MDFNNEDIKIQKVTSLDDAKVIVEFQLQMALETEKLNLNPETVKSGVSAVILDSAKGTYYKATRNNKIIGCLLTVPEWSDWRNGTVLWIHSVYVRPEYRQSKVFSKMYGYLKEMVNENSEHFGLRLYVDKTNQRAQKVYKALGMTEDHYSLYEWMK